MQPALKKDNIISLDVTHPNLSGYLWSVLPEATKIQHHILRTLVVGFTVHFKLRVKSLVAEAYPDNHITMKGKFTSTTDGSVYLAVVGNDDIEYMKVTITKDNVNEFEIGEGGKIRLYQNPKNKDKQINKTFANLSLGWEVTKVYEQVRDAVFEIMSILIENGLYSKVLNTKQERMVLEESYRQKPIDTKTIDGGTMVHDESNTPEPMDALKQFREEKAREKQRQDREAGVHRIRIAPTMIPFRKNTQLQQLQEQFTPLPPTAAPVVTDGRDVTYSFSDVETTIIKNAVDDVDVIEPEVIEAKPKDDDKSESLVVGILKSLINIVDYNKSLGLPPFPMPKKKPFFSFGGRKLQFSL